MEKLYRRFLIILIGSYYLFLANIVSAAEILQYEFENLTFINSSGQGFAQSKPYTEASNGMYFQYNSNGVGQYITFPIEISAAGTYNLNLQYDLRRYRGTFLVEVSDDPNTGYVEIGRMDMTVNSGQSIETLPLTPYQFGSVGTYYIRFRVTGSNPNTGSERMGLDKIDVIPQ